MRKECVTGAMGKLESWNTITLFCILIFGFTAATFLKPDTEYSENENRTLAQMPDVSAETVLDGSFEEDYEKYLTDQFVGRDGWIGVKTKVELALLRKESKDIYFAADDYLIEKHTGVFDTDLAKRNAAALGQFVSQYTETFGEDHMTVLLVPNAVDILTDKLPAYAPAGKGGQYLEGISQGISEKVWLDAGEVLNSHASEDIYYRTDHHWTTRAAFYVYQAWAKKQGFAVPEASDYLVETATESFEGTIQSKLGIDAHPDTIELYLQKDDPLYTVQKNGAEDVSYSVYDRTALDTKSKYDVFFGGNQAQVTIRTHAGNGRSILVLKDSYAHCFVPFLLESFDRIDMVDLRYYNQKLSDLIAQEDYTDVLVLYNASGFAEDAGVSRLLY